MLYGSYGFKPFTAGSNIGLLFQKLQTINMVYLALIITFILLISLFLNLDFSLLGKTIADINLVLLSISIIPIVLEILVKSMRLRALVLCLTRISLRSSMAVTLIGFPFGTITPGRIGDLIKVHALSQKTSLPLSKSFGIGFFEKILELGSLSLLVAVSIIGLALTGIFGKPLALIFIIAVGIILMLLLTFHQRLAKKILQYVLLRILPSKYHNSFNEILENFYTIFTAILSRIKTVASIIFLSLFLWLNRIIQVFILSLALGMEVHLGFFFLVMPIAFVAEIIPITIMGLGVREYLYLFLFSLIGITQETSVILSLLVLTLGILPPAIVGYFVVLKEYGGIAKLRQTISI